MRGMWNKEKSVNSSHRPALDALTAVEPSLLGKAIYAAIADGGALMFAATRDFGAINLTLMSGEQRVKVYPTNVQELNEALTDLVESLTVTDSSSRPNPKRG